jgi:RNA polymerase sigma-70 factor (ECF subfamily)
LEEAQKIELVQRCLKGKKMAYKQLYELYEQDMFKICRMYAPDYDSANDFLQEGFIKIFQKLHRFEPNGSLGGWMRRVMVNNCIDLLRRDHWSKITVHLEENLTPDEEPVWELELSEQFQEIHFFEFIEMLPVGYRTILNLYYLEELKHHEIAEKLSISVGTSKSQLSRAKIYLRSLLLKHFTKEELETYVGRLVREVV